MKRLVFLTLLFSIVTVATAEETRFRDTSTYGFYESCESEEDWVFFYCIGYLDAFYEGFADLGWICPPFGVNSNQIRKIFLKWVDENPQHLHQHRIVSVVTAFVEAFPCRTKDEKELTPEQALDQFIDSLLNKEEE